MEDAPVAAPSNALANHSATSQQPPLSDGADSEDAEQSDLVLSLERPKAPLVCGGDTDDENEDDQRGAFDYFTPARAVEALGKPKVASDVTRPNDAFFDTVDRGMTSSSDSTQVAEEYEMKPTGVGMFDTHLSSRYKMQEEIYNAEMRANNDRQYDERFSVSSADSGDDSDDNLSNVIVRPTGDECYVQMPDPSYDDDDGMECINQATKMRILQPLNSYASQNYGSTSVHSHVDVRGVDSATGFSRGLTAASGALPANRARIEKSTYSKRPNPPFGDPVHPELLVQSALQLLPNRVQHSSLEDPPIRKTDDTTAAESAMAKKKKKKKKHTKGDETEDTRPQRDINGNPVVATTKKQPSSGKTTDSGSSEPHSRADSGYEFSDLSQSQMSSSSDSRFLEKKAKKAKRGRKEPCTMQAKDIPGNRGNEPIETLVDFIDNGQKKQRQQNGQVNGVPSLAPVTLGGATEQRASYSAKKPGCGRGERKVSETNSKGQSGGSEGKASSDACTGSEGSSVSDSVANMNSVLDTRSTKDASLVSPIHIVGVTDTYIFTDFGCTLPQEDDFKEVKKKKKRPKEPVTPVQKDAVFHALCQVEPHRKPHVSAHSVTPPPTSSVCSDDAHVERALSPSSFPVLGRSREGRRNSTGNAPPVDGMQDDSDMESVKSVPIGSDLGGQLDGGLSPSNLAKQSYAKIAAAQRPGKDSGALYRAEQTHLTGTDGHAAGVKYGKDVNREKAVITSVEHIETLGAQNTKPVAGCAPNVAGCGTSVPPPQSTCVQLALFLPVLSSVDTSPHSDSVRTLVMPDDVVTITKKTLAQMDMESTDQTLVCSQSSTHGVQINDGSSSLPVSGLDSCPRTRSEPSVCSGLHSGSIESRVSPIRPVGIEEEPHTDIPEFIAEDITGQRVCPENVPCHAAVAVPPSDKQDVVAKETQSSNKSLPSSAGAVVGDVSVRIVNTTNIDSSKMLSPQNNSGLPPATRVGALPSAGSCSRVAAVAPKAGISSTAKRSKTNKSVIFFDKKLNEQPQNLGISFGFGPETISVNEIAKNSDGGSCNDACMTCERDDPVTSVQPPPPRDSSLSQVAVTTPSSQLPGRNATDIYRAKFVTPMNGVVLPHTASPHQGVPPDLVSSSVSRAYPEHVHLVSDSPVPSHAAKPSGRHDASLLYSRTNDFNFQRGKFDVEGAVTFLYKEWEKVTRSKRTSRVTFYKNQYN